MERSSGKDFNKFSGTLKMEYHKPVLLNETLEFLNVKKDGKYIDCTLGDGGHTIEILKLGGKVLGIDYNDKSLDRATKRIMDLGLDKNFTAVKGNFENIKNLAEQEGFTQVNGILFDLGYSSYHLTDDEIGMSFLKDQPLDMRLDTTLGVTAADLINTLTEEHLNRLFWDFGEEKHARKLAKEIVKARELEKFYSTKQLADFIKERISLGHENIHPATKVFMALRIAVNTELENLQASLPWAAHLLLPGGRMIIISFHSLEDRIVKQFGRGARPRLINLTRQPVLPSMEEVASNSRSRSAKLRAYEKE